MSAYAGRPCSRRGFIATALAAGAAWSLWPGRLGAEGAAKDGGPFTFLAVNDLHFTDPARCGPWLERVFKAMRRDAPAAEFLLVNGDLTSGAREAEFAGIRDAFKTLGLPVYVTPGNHDMAADGGHRLFDAYFPGQFNQCFEHRGRQFIGVNSAVDQSYEKTRIPASTFDWLDKNLGRLVPSKPTVLFTHFPLGQGVTYRPVNADDLLERFRDFNLQAVLNGHWHGFSQTRWRGAWIATSRCCARSRGNHDGSDKKGWLVCDAKEDRIDLRFAPFLDDPAGKAAAPKAGA